jgi:hypothetical protein
MKTDIRKIIFASPSKTPRDGIGDDVSIAIEIIRK